MSDYEYVNNYGKVKIDATSPNKITPKLQKGLILDMPLAEPYTEANNTIVKDKTPNGNDGTVNGATIKYDGLVNTGDGVAYIPQIKAYGIITFRVKYQTTGASYIFMSQEISGATGYGIKLTSDGKVQLIKDTVQIMESAINYIIDNTNYLFKITRSLTNLFTIYVKGGSFGWSGWTIVGSFIDSTYTTSKFMTMIMTTNCEISDLRIS